MARSHARIALGIWADPDWLALPMHAQWLYQALLSQGDINHAGIISLTSRRWTRLCADADLDMIESGLKVLADRRYIVVDPEHQQLLVRSFVRNDGVWRQPNTLKAACTSMLLLTSPVLRAALLAELRRIPQRRVEAMRTTTGHTPAVVVLRDTISALAAGENPPPDHHSATPSDGYGDGYVRDPIADPLPCGRAGDGEGVGDGEPSLSSRESGSEGGTRATAAAPPPPPTITGLLMAVPAGIPDEPPRCRRCSKLPPDVDQPCRTCRRLRERWQADVAERDQAAADRRASEAARAAQQADACGRCDRGWLLAADGTPAVPARRCRHEAVSDAS